MIKNYLNVMLRNILKNKLTFFVNIFGLAVGIASCIIILQYINHELSYEDWNKNAGNLYRLVVKRYSGGELTYLKPVTPHGMGPAMKKDFPEVIEYSRVNNLRYNSVILGINSFKERVLGVDPSFLSMFAITMLKGDSSTALQDPNAAVISGSLAKKYFGDENPIGKSFRLSRYGVERVYFIRGVFNDIPENSHLRCDIFVPIYNTLITYFRGEDWDDLSFYLYVLLEKGVDPKSLEAKLPAFLDKYFSKRLLTGNHRFEYFLQPLKDIHLYSTNILFQLEEGGDIKYIYFLSILTFFILCVAWINYINLSAIKSIDRAREVGIRKVVGANKLQLIKQFFAEFILISIVGVFLAILLVRLSTPFFNQLFGISLSFSLILKSKVFLFMFFLVFIGGTLLSGVYPAFVLSSFKPVDVIKGKILNNNTGIDLRKIFLIFQFMVFIFFIVATLSINRQIEFMRNHDLGIDKENIILMEVQASTHSISYSVNKEILFFEELKKNPAIYNATMGNSPGIEYYAMTSLRRIDSTLYRDLFLNWVDYDFIDTYRIKLLAGRNFSRDYPTDRYGACMINEKALKLFQFNSPQDAVDKYLIDSNYSRFKIIGVTKNYNQLSLKYEVGPLVYHFTPHAGEYYSVKLKNNKNIDEVIAFIKQKYEEILVGSSFSYVFLDDFFDRQYAGEKQFRGAFLFFSIVAAVICCLGLYSLVSYRTFQRAKEVAIRKVYGAKTFDILLILLKDTFKLISIAVIFTFPVAILAVNEWLRNFAYRFKIDFWFFANPLLLLVLIVFLTVSYKVVKVATANLINSLRNE